MRVTGSWAIKVAIAIEEIIRIVAHPLSVFVAAATKGRLTFIFPLATRSACRSFNEVISASRKIGVAIAAHTGLGALVGQMSLGLGEQVLKAENGSSPAQCITLAEMG